jgi:phosphorylcholine metabolism protein LicD
VIYIKSKFSLDTIQDVIRLISAHNINYWMDHGSLLGLIRNKKFIEWDTDIDIGAWYDSEQKIKLIKKNLEKKYKHVSYNFITNAISVRFFDQDFMNHWSIDIVFYYRKKGMAVKYYVDTTTNNGKILGKITTIFSGDLAPVSKKRWVNNIIKIIYPIRKLFINKIITKNLNKYTPKVVNSVDEKYFDFITTTNSIYGELRIPEKYFSYLELRYGSQWRTPTKKWNYLLDDGGVGC